MMIDAPGFKKAKKQDAEKELEPTAENVEAFMRKSGLKLDGTPL